MGRSLYHEGATRGLQLRRARRVALIDVARHEAALEPSHALRGRAVRERIRRHAALRALLQPVVADGGRGADPLLEIARLEDVPRAIGVVRPDAGEAVGLELAADGDRRRAASARALAHAREPEQLLHVMTDLVGDHVRLREVAGRAEPIAELAEEVEVEIDALVAGTIERTDGRFRHPARGAHRAGEEHELRLAVFAVHAREDVLPGLL